MGHTNKHIILDHLAQSKGLRRKDLVTFICINNGYEGHKRGYYGTTLQQWALEGYIKKKGNKWHIGNLGRLYLKDPKQATLKASLNKMTKGRDAWREAYHEAQQNANHYRIEHDEAIEEIVRLKGEIARLKANTDCIGEAFGGNAEDIADHERLMEVYIEVRDERDNLIKEVEELRAELDTEEVVYESDMDELRNKIYKLEIELSKADKQIITLTNQGIKKTDTIEALQSKLTIAPNTLVKMPPPSTDYSDFSKGELISMTKHLLHLLSEQ